MNEDFLHRLELERVSLASKLEALTVFLREPFANVAINELAIMEEQREIMLAYLHCLDKRIGFHKSTIKETGSVARPF